MQLIISYHSQRLKQYKIEDDVRYVICHRKKGRVKRKDMQ